MLQQDLKLALSQYIKDPIVSVIVTSFNSTFSQQVRVVGATEKPASIPFRANMTVLDAMIAVGGLGEYAAGNKARLVRFDKGTGKQHEYRSEEHTSELQSLMRISYAVFCLKKKIKTTAKNKQHNTTKINKH